MCLLVSDGGRWRVGGHESTHQTPERSRDGGEIVRPAGPAGGSRGPGAKRGELL